MPKQYRVTHAGARAINNVCVQLEYRYESLDDVLAGTEAARKLLRAAVQAGYVCGIDDAARKAEEAATENPERRARIESDQMLRKRVDELERRADASFKHHQADVKSLVRTIAALRKPEPGVVPKRVHKKSCEEPTRNFLTNDYADPSDPTKFSGIAEEDI